MGKADAHERKRHDGKERARPQRMFSTSCHPDRELVAVQIHSALIAQGRLSVLLAFPYGSSGFSGSGADWGRPDAHQTVMTRQGNQRADFVRTLDNDRYYAALSWAKGNQLTTNGAHRYLLTGNTNSQTIEFVAAFSQSVLPAKLPNAPATKTASAKMWKKFSRQAPMKRSFAMRSLGELK